MLRARYIAYFDTITPPAALTDRLKSCAVPPEKPSPFETTDTVTSFGSFSHRRGIARLKWGLVLAACILLLCALSVTVFAPSSAPPQSAAPATAVENIVWNELSEFSISDQKLYFNGPDTRFESWTLAQVLDYLGTDPRPLALPTDLFPLYMNRGYPVSVRLSDGELLYDNFTFSYADYAGEEYRPLTRSFDLTVSRSGIVDDVVYCTPDECSPSVLSDVSVVLGRRTMDYGPYDPVTHLPSGFYPLFVADFEQEGLHYRAVSHNLTEAEFLDLLRQIVSR